MERQQQIDWVNIYYFIGTPLLAAILIPLYVAYCGWSWSMFLVACVLGFFTNLSTTAGYHRYFSHKSYDAHPLLRSYYLWMGAFSIMGPVVHWVSDHRKHHRFVDTESDPYNIKRGFFYAHMGWLFHRPTEEVQCEYAPDLLKDPACRWQRDNYAMLVIILAFGVPMLLGAFFWGAPIGGLLILGLLRVIVCNHCTFLINSACHTFGKQPYSDENTARDSFILGVLACGEGYHNYHHVFASDYRNGIRWYDWDPTKWWIRALSYLGLTRNLKQAASADILRARLHMDEKRMLQLGAPAELFVPLKTQIQDAQRRVRELKEEYFRLKKTAQDRSRQGMRQLRYELRAAKADFRRSLAQWAYYLRRYRVVPKPVAVRS